MEKKTISHRVLSEFFAPNQISQAKQGPYCNTRIDILSKKFRNLVANCIGYTFEAVSGRYLNEKRVEKF